METSKYKSFTKECAAHHGPVPLCHAHFVRDLLHILMCHIQLPVIFHVRGLLCEDNYGDVEETLLVEDLARLNIVHWLGWEMQGDTLLGLDHVLELALALKGDVYWLFVITC